VRWTRRILVAAGTAVMAYAIVGLLTDPATDPPRQLAFLAAVLVAHDAVFLPLVLGAGALVSRWAPPPLRTPVRVAGIISLALAVVAMPFVLGYGRRPDDPSALPLDYGRGLLVLLTIVWAVALVPALLTSLRRRLRQPAAHGALRRVSGIIRPPGGKG
jgi:threonine/homoserine/homoserine lactone efflux protein